MYHLIVLHSAAHWTLFHTEWWKPYHFLQVRGYTSLRAMTPKGNTNGWASGGLLLLLGPGWQLSEQAPWSPSSGSGPLVPPQAPSSSADLTVGGATLSCCPASPCTSSCILSTSRDSSSMLRCCSKSGRTTGLLRSMSSVSCPAGTLGSPCRNEHRHSQGAMLLPL